LRLSIADKREYSYNAYRCILQRMIGFIFSITRRERHSGSFRNRFFVGLLILALYSTAGAEVRSAPCPFGCREAGLSFYHCRAWRQGTTCFVEDTRSTQPTPQHEPSHPIPQPVPHPTNPVPQGRSSAASAGCQRVTRYEITPPRITTYQIQPVSGRSSSQVYQITGTIEGACIAQAGLFEYNILKQSIPIITTRDFRQFHFQVIVQSDRRPEIRAYTVTGDQDTLRVFGW
jgi:hypothetical protein